MLLGKRPRPPMRRTTSLSEITLDLNTPTSADVPLLDLNNPAVNRQKPVGGAGASGGGADGSWKQQNGLDQSVLASVSPRNHRRPSADFVEPAGFLRSCSLCKRRLVPSRDIYMYRGDSAFCSLECRQQQMNQDEMKEKKCSMASKKQAVATAASSSAGSQVASKGETVAAL